MNAAFMEYLPPPPVPATVCVVDTGVDLTPDTAPFVVDRLTVMGDGLLNDAMTPYGHGTAVAAVMGAPRNGYGGVGLWPHVRVVSVRAATQFGGIVAFTWNDYDRALRRCLEVPGVNTVNFSLGGTFGGLDYLYFTDRVLLANRAGVSVVASAGNVPGVPTYPAAAEGVVAIAANDVGGDGSLCSFSAAAPQILSSPGCNVEASSTTGEVLLWNGTSFSSPLVSVLLGALRTYRPDLSRHQIENIVVESARLGPDGRSAVVDADAAFRAAGLGAVVDAAWAQTPGPRPSDAGLPKVGVPTTSLVVPDTPKVRWVRRLHGAVVIRIAPLATGVHLKVTGSDILVASLPPQFEPCRQLDRGH